MTVSAWDQVPLAVPLLPPDTPYPMKWTRPRLKWTFQYRDRGSWFRRLVHAYGPEIDREVNEILFSVREGNKLRLWGFLSIVRFPLSEMEADEPAPLSH